MVQIFSGGVFCYDVTKNKYVTCCRYFSKHCWCEKFPFNYCLLPWQAVIYLVSDNKSILTYNTKGNISITVMWFLKKFNRYTLHQFLSVWWRTPQAQRYHSVYTMLSTQCCPLLIVFPFHTQRASLTCRLQRFPAFLAQLLQHFWVIFWVCVCMKIHLKTVHCLQEYIRNYKKKTVLDKLCFLCR